MVVLSVFIVKRSTSRHKLEKELYLNDWTNEWREERDEKKNEQTKVFSSKHENGVVQNDFTGFLFFSIVFFFFYFYFELSFDCFFFNSSHSLTIFMSLTQTFSRWINLSLSFFNRFGFDLLKLAIQISIQFHLIGHINKVIVFRCSISDVRRFYFVSFFFLLFLRLLFCFLVSFHLRISL